MLAAIDLGSNSFRLHIGMYDGETIRVVKSARDQVRLGAGLDTDGNLTEEAMQAALESLQQFREILTDFALDAVRVVATNALRLAQNAHTFLPLAEQAIGYPIEIISGEEEGRLIYMGVATAVPGPGERRLVIDIGGGSTEVILGKDEVIEQVESFSIGTVPQSQTFFPDGRINAASFDAAVLAARSYFEDYAPAFHSRNWKAAYGSSGTIRSIAELIAANFSEDTAITRAALEALKVRLVEAGHIKHMRLAAVRPERMPAVLGGMSVLLALMHELDIDQIMPVDAGLRMGVLRDLQLRSSPADRRDQSVRMFMQRFHVEQERAERAARLAGEIFERLKPETQTYAKYLYWSGLLHEVGLVVSHTGYHKHASYIVSNADIPGFTGREQRILSTLVLAQKGSLRKVSEALEEADFAKAVLALRLAVLLMHSRTKVNVSELRIKMKNRIELDVAPDWVDTHASAYVWLAKERDAWNDAGVDFLLRTEK